MVVTGSMLGEGALLTRNLLLLLLPVCGTEYECRVVCTVESIYFGAAAAADSLHGWLQLVPLLGMSNNHPGHDQQDAGMFDIGTSCTLVVAVPHHLLVGY